MTTIEYLVTQLGEEAAEIVQQCAKMNRFGPLEVWPDKKKNPKELNNIDRLEDELNDLMALVQLCCCAGILPHTWQDREKQAKKIEKVRKYLKYAEKQCKTVKDEPTEVWAGWKEQAGL